MTSEDLCGGRYCALAVGVCLASVSSQLMFRNRGLMCSAERLGIYDTAREDISRTRRYVHKMPASDRQSYARNTSPGTLPALSSLCWHETVTATNAMNELEPNPQVHRMANHGSDHHGSDCNAVLSLQRSDCPSFCCLAALRCSFIIRSHHCNAPARCRHATKAGRMPFATRCNLNRIL